MIEAVLTFILVRPLCGTNLLTFDFDVLQEEVPTFTLRMARRNLPTSDLSEHNVRLVSGLKISTDFY